MWITRLFLMLNSCAVSSARVPPSEFTKERLRHCSRLRINRVGEKNLSLRGN